VDLHKMVGDAVEEGEPLYTIFARFKADFEFAIDMAGRDIGFQIGGSNE